MPFTLMEELSFKGVVFSSSGLKLLLSELLVAEETAAKHSNRGVVTTLMHRGEAKRDVERAVARVSVAFELLGVKAQDLPHTGCEGGEWRWTGVWKWVEHGSQDEALARKSVDVFHQHTINGDFSPLSGLILTPSRSLDKPSVCLPRHGRAAPGAGADDDTAAAAGVGSQPRRGSVTQGRSDVMLE